MGDQCALVQSQKAVAAYLKSDQLSPYIFAYECVAQLAWSLGVCLINHRPTTHVSYHLQKPLLNIT